MDRRHFVVISGTTLTAFAHDWLIDPERVAASVRGKRVNHAVVDDLDRVADALGGGTVFRAAREVPLAASLAALSAQVGLRGT